MSTTIGGIAANSDIQSMMSQMLNKMNKADVDKTSGLSKSELSSIDTTNDAGGAAFIQSLQEQFDSLDANSDGQLSDDEMKNAKPTQDKLGAPAGMEIADASETEETDPYQQLINSLMNSLVSSLDTDGDGKISADEMKAGAKKIQEQLTKTSETTAAAGSTETAGSTANAELGDNLKNLAGNFIQKLIDSYKDKGSVLGITASNLSAMI